MSDVGTEAAVAALGRRIVELEAENAALRDELDLARRTNQELAEAFADDNGAPLPNLRAGAIAPGLGDALGAMAAARRVGVPAVASEAFRSAVEGRT